MAVGAVLPVGKQTTSLKHQTAVGGDRVQTCQHLGAGEGGGVPSIPV
jgi:hypothetical protein